ncbi:MAG: hypothetical protein M9955_01810 [Rhizobiaceae bacterium]|nr:hypothetical protein [Rhizobiaceae bacterium]
MRAKIAAIAILSSIVPAAASGGLGCTAKDKKVAFELNAGITRGMGSPIFSFDGKVEIRDKGVAADLRKTAFKMDHVAQYWLDGKELRLDLYREREGSKPHGYVELVLYTKAKGDENEYAGTYELIVYDTVGDNVQAKQAKFKGKVGCFVE